MILYFTFSIIPFSDRSCLYFISWHTGPSIQHWDDVSLRWPPWASVSHNFYVQPDSSASDSRSEGCVFESRRAHILLFYTHHIGHCCTKLIMELRNDTLFHIFQNTFLGKELSLLPYFTSRCTATSIQHWDDASLYKPTSASVCHNIYVQPSNFIRFIVLNDEQLITRVLTLTISSYTHALFNQHAHIHESHTDTPQRQPSTACSGDIEMINRFERLQSGSFPTWLCLLLKLLNSTVSFSPIKHYPTMFHPLNVKNHHIVT